MRVEQVLCGFVGFFAGMMLTIALASYGASRRDKQREDYDIRTSTIREFLGKPISDL